MRLVYCSGIAVDSNENVLLQFINHDNTTDAFYYRDKIGRQLPVVDRAPIKNHQCLLLQPLPQLYIVSVQGGAQGNHS